MRRNKAMNRGYSSRFPWVSSTHNIHQHSNRKVDFALRENGGQLLLSFEIRKALVQARELRIRFADIPCGEQKSVASPPSVVSTDDPRSFWTCFADFSYEVSSLFDGAN